MSQDAGGAPTALETAGRRRVSAEAVAFVKAHEALHELRDDGLVHPYHDAAGFPTVGWGHLLSRTAWADLSAWPPLSVAQCEALLAVDLEHKAERPVARLIAWPLSQGQFDAMASFAFNVGAGALQRSTLRQKLNRGEVAEVPGELMRWTRAGGRVLRGLVRRRFDEAVMFAEGIEDATLREETLTRFLHRFRRP